MYVNMKMLKIKNKFGENLDVLIEGKEDAETSIIFVHGFGTDKNEGSLFIDISQALSDKFRIIRFDFSGYGKSEGRQEDVDYAKQAGDLDAVLSYIRPKYPGRINIVAHSMGTFITAFLSPIGIKKSIFTGVPNTDTVASNKRLQDRIIKRGGVVNENGITIYPRTSGAVQKIGPSFWKIKREFNAIKAFEKYAEKSQLVIFKPLQDEVVGNDNFDGYKNIPNLTYREINGAHNFSKPQDRRELIENIKAIFEN